ncbi:MAG: hypothetical protein K6G26_14110 [Lachnospiraceae bacterium]|nr:hypothetical protein [Lachnospiraceae bacterium]
MKYRIYKIISTDNTIQQKTKFYNELAKKMLEFTQELERNNYITAVCQRYNIEQSGFVKVVNHYGALAIASGGIETKSYEPEKKYKPKDKDESIKAIWRVLLSWYAEEQRLFSLLDGIISADDFIDPYNLHKL